MSAELDIDDVAATSGLAVAQLAVLRVRIAQLEAALKDWIHQAGMFAHWSPQRIQENIEVYFTVETKGGASEG